MKAPKVVTAASAVLSAGLLIWASGVVAQQPKPEPPTPTRQISGADSKAIRDIVEGQETAWNKHDMEAFTKAYRQDTEGINVVGMYWRGKPAILKHLTEYHKTIFKDLKETLEEVAVHPIGDGYAIAVSIWKVGAFRSPSGAEVPACRHRSTLVLAKGAEGWQVVHFHNTTIDEAAVRGGSAPPQK